MATTRVCRSASCAVRLRIAVATGLLGTLPRPSWGWRRGARALDRKQSYSGRRRHSGLGRGPRQDGSKAVPAGVREDASRCEGGPPLSGPSSISRCSLRRVAWPPGAQRVGSGRYARGGWGADAVPRAQSRRSPPRGRRFYLVPVVSEYKAPSAMSPVTAAEWAGAGGSGCFVCA